MSDKVMYAIAAVAVLVVFVVMLDVACMVFLDMRLTEVPRRAAIAAGLLSSQAEPTATASPLVKATPTLKPAEATPQGVRVGMPADDVLNVWGKGLRSEQVGSDVQGLIVEWVYEDAILVMKRWEIGGVTCYRVAEIRLR